MWSVKNAASWALSVAAIALPEVALLLLVLTVAPGAWAQSDSSKPESLNKQRTDLYLHATRAPMANLEGDINHIAVLSETCRVKYGSAACGLGDKALESDKIDDRYAYYVKQPVEAHAKIHPARIDRRNWTGSSASAQQ